MYDIERNFIRNTENVDDVINYRFILDKVRRLHSSVKRLPFKASFVDVMVGFEERFSDCCRCPMTLK